MDVEYLRFDREDFSLEEIRSIMKYYRGIGHVVMAEINGEKIYSNDPNLDDFFKRLELGLNEEEYKDLKGLERDNQVYKQRISNAKDIEDTKYYRFYYGLAKTMIKPDRINEFETTVNFYGSKFMNDLIVITQIMLALENDNKIEIYREISNILVNVKDMDIDFDRVYHIVKNSAIKGDMLDLVFFKDTTLDYRNKLIRKLNINNKRIDEIKNR